MAYSELVKNFNRVRDYMREFYVYGFKSRGEYTRKSARSYDDERRRLESWLGDYMKFRQTPEGKNVFISVDSRLSEHNPLYAAWKARSFTDGDITLHFLLMDMLSSPDICLSLKDIMAGLDEYLAHFSEPRLFDESTVRKKIQEYVSEGVLLAEKRGRLVYYRRSEGGVLPDGDVLDYFSEVLPCGVIGSFLLDKTERRERHFAFKHHYISGAMDSEVLCAIFRAIREKRAVSLELLAGDRTRLRALSVIPLKLMLSVQSGRQYLMAWREGCSRVMPIRVDTILSVKPNEADKNFDKFQQKFESMLPHIWGVSTQGRQGSRMEYVSFTVRYSGDEQHIRKRLEREKRCGRVEHLDRHTSRFSAEVYDARELVPWIRTFICRITDIHFSDSELEAQFKNDIREMYAIYGLGGEG